MKKKIKDLTEKEWKKLCDASKGCDFCKLRKVCLVDLSMTLKEKKEFYKEFNKEVEIK